MILWNHWKLSSVFMVAIMCVNWYSFDYFTAKKNKTLFFFVEFWFARSLDLLPIFTALSRPSHCGQSCEFFSSKPTGDAMYWQGKASAEFQWWNDSETRCQLRDPSVLGPSNTGKLCLCNYLAISSFNCEIYWNIRDIMWCTLHFISVVFIET